MTEQDSRPTSPRRRRRRQRTMEAILEASRDIMRQHGAAALTMHELARRMEMRPPSLYNYFAGLMDIYDALFQLGFTLWGDYLNQHLAGVETWQDEIRLAMEAYMGFAQENPELYQLCFERPVPGFVPSEESLRISFGILETAYARVAGLRDILKTDLPPEQLTDLIIAFSHGLTALHLANQPELPVGQGRFGSLIPAAVSILTEAWS